MVIRALKSRIPGIRVEVLVPDFKGSMEALAEVMAAGPTVFNHNIETVPSLYGRARPEADYQRSLSLLSAAASQDGIPAKSGIMVGLGETEAELLTTLKDLRSVGVELLTLGQYLQPGPGWLEVVEYVSPERFSHFVRMAEGLGFSGISAGPFVRSSHRAGKLYERYLNRVEIP
jgi:lipoic acid synthetase